MTMNGKIKIEGDGKEVLAMFKAISSAAKKNKSDTKKAGDDMSKGFDSNMKKMQKSAQATMNLMKGAFAAAIIKSGLEQIKTLEAINVRTAFLAQSNKELASAIGEIEQATVGYLKAADAISAANVLQVSGIKMSKDEFIKYTEAVTIMSLKLGRDPVQQLEKFTNGLNRQRIMLIDDLIPGIEQNSIVWDRYAKTLGKTSSELTESEKKIAFIENALKKLNEQITETDKKTLNSNTRFTQQINRGEKALLDAKKAGLSFLGETANFSEKIAGRVADTVTGEVGVIDFLFTNVNTKIKKTSAEEKERWSQANLMREKAMEGLNDFDRAMVKSNGEFYNQIIALDNSTKAWKGLGEAIKKTWSNSQKAEGTLGKIFDKLITPQTVSNLDKLGNAFKKLGNDMWGKGLEMQAEDRKERIKKYNEDRLILQKQLGTALFNNEKEYIKAEDKIEDIRLANVMAKTDKRYTSLNNAALKYEITRIQFQKKIDASKEENVNKALEAFNQATLDTAKKLKVTGEEILKIDQENYDREYEAFLAQQKRLSDATDEQMKEQRKSEANALKEREKAWSMGGAIITGVSNQMYDVLIGNSEASMQEIAAIALKQAGSMVYADGIQRVWKGLGDTLNITNPVQAGVGATQMAYGGLEIAAGIGMGALGNAITPSGGNTPDESKADAASDRAKDIDTTSEANVTVFMYKSEREHINQLAKSQKKLKTNKIGRR